MRSQKIAMAVGSAVAALVNTAAPAAGASAGADVTRMRAPTLNMVNLGDSYSAGYTRLAGGPVEPDAPGKSGCEQTWKSYPYVLADELADRFGRPVNVTCGGATTDNVLDTPQRPVGRTSLDRLGTPQADPLAPFPMRSPQIDAVHADTDVVTVGVGGNDYFSRLLAKCLEADATSSDPHQCQDNLKNGRYADLGFSAHDPYLDAMKHVLAGKYRNLLGQLHARAPHAHIYVIGYPSVIPEDTSTCARNSQELFTLNRGDMDWLREIMNRMTTAIGSATADAAERDVPADFIDTRPATTGKDACAPRDVKWVEGYTEKIGTIGAGGWGEPALIHPNDRYHRYVAARLAERIRHDFRSRRARCGRGCDRIAPNPWDPGTDRTDGTPGDLGSGGSFSRLPTSSGTPSPTPRPPRAG